MNVPGACDRVVRWGLVALIAFAPLAFGTVEPWAYAILEGSGVALLLTFAFGRLWAGQTPGGHFPRTGLLGPMVGFIGFCALQLVPLPPPLLRAVSPGAAEAYAAPARLAAAGFESAGAVAPEDRLRDAAGPVRRPVSLAPGATGSRTRFLAVMTGVFLLVSWWVDRRERALFILVAVVVVGFLVSIEGLVQYLTWNGRIYWFRRVPPAAVFGPFVNHNHFAAFAGMIIPLALALAVHGATGRRASRMPSMARAGENWRGTTPVGDPRFGQVGLALFAFAIIAVGLVFSLSRGGILASVVSLGVMFLVLRRRLASTRLLRIATVGVPLLVLALVFWIGAGVVAERWGQIQAPGEASLRSRVVVWRTIVESVGPFLRTGAGLGAFEASFAPFAPAGSSTRWDQAHNDYLQLLWETGLPGSLLAAWLIGISVVRYGWPAMREARHDLDILRTGAATGLLSIAVHSLADFNLQIGANGFLCAVLAGVLVALTRLVATGPEKDGARLGHDRSVPASARAGERGGLD